MAEAALDPEIMPFVPAVPVFELSREGLPAARELVKTMAPSTPPPLSDDVVRTDHVVPDAPHVIVRVYRPRGVDEPLPCVLYTHGGGYIFGRYDDEDARFDKWCLNFCCVGVSVEYRLAPGSSYPGPLEDCYAGLRWVHQNASALGVDPARIGIAGPSAGGGLTAGLGLLARDRGEVPLQFQLLECPMIDDRQTTASSQLDGLLLWSRESNAFGWQCYLGDLYGSDDVPIYAAAARATDLSGLPPTMVIVGGADGFRDENIRYALRLGEAGVPTELHVLPGAPHGVQLFVTTRLAQQWISLVDSWLGRMLAR